MTGRADDRRGGESAAADAPQALAALRAALRGLTRHLGPADSADLVALGGALDRIEARLSTTSALPGDEPARLDRLIELAGPRDAAELLRRIRADLAGAAQRIEAALPLADRAALRSATHVLIAVAGSVGALALAAQARVLNTAAHADTPARQPDAAAVQALEDLGRPVLVGIARLSRCLAGRERTVR